MTFQRANVGLWALLVLIVGNVLFLGAQRVAAGDANKIICLAYDSINETWGFKLMPDYLCSGDVIPGPDVPSILPQCANNVDDDGDGFKDFGTASSSDPGCISPLDDDESPFDCAAGKTYDGTGCVDAPATTTTATLTVVKVVVNDSSSSTKTVADFELFVDGSPVLSGVATTTATGTHTISETSDSEYDATFSGDCDAQGQITLAAGEVKTCTITNDDKTPGAPQQPAPTGPTGGGGSSRITGGGSIGGGGGIPQVLGAATSIPSGLACDQYLTAFIKPGAENDSAQVYRLQALLATFEGAELELTGVYDEPTVAAVHTFQTKYAADILAPWGISKPTGYVYLTTRKKVNEIYCAGRQAFPLTEAEQHIIEKSKIARPANPARDAQAASAAASVTTAPAEEPEAETEADEGSIMNTPGNSLMNFFRGFFDRFR